MNYKLKVTGIESTEALESRAFKCAQRIEKFTKKDDTSVKCEFEIGKTTKHHHKGDVFRAEIHLHTAGKNHYAEATNEDLYDSLEEVTDEIIREITEHNDKKRTMFKRGAQKVKDMLRGLSRK
jgi:ribosomal subunit interface protein